MTVTPDTPGHAVVRPVDGPVGRDDIEAKLREITGEVAGEVAGARNLTVAGAVAIVAAVVVVAFVLGRRRGKRRITVVEVRRL